MDRTNKMGREELAQEIFRVAYLVGEFKLRSGQSSHEYFDKYRFEAIPQLLKEIAFHLSPLIPGETEVLGGLEMGGIPLATALSMETGHPLAFVRKEAKTYGTCQLAEGTSVKGKRVCLIEDIITTGGQVIKSTKQLREQGATVNTVISVIDRGGALSTQKLLMARLHHRPLFTMEELRTFSHERL